VPVLPNALGALNNHKEENMGSMCHRKEIQVRKNEYSDADFNMRRRFYEQTVRFWKQSQKKDKRNSQGVGKATGPYLPKTNVQKR
jgi:hypothetical protein